MRQLVFQKKNYDKLLQSWSALVLKNNVVLDVSSKYCDTVSRQTIIDDFRWTINDLGQADSVTCESLSTNDIAVLSNRMYPNPTNDILNVESNYNASYNIVFVLGQQVAHGNLRIGANAINMSNLNGSVYVITINTNSVNETFRFIKN